VILLATENLLLSTTDLATIMRNKTADGGLECVDAINFDGGHSTQLYTRLQNFNLQVPSFTAVADAVLVSPR
jgi:exopolysaccharide biosynthesis protein